MTELADLIPDSAGVSLRRGRVISVSGRNLTVDLGAGEAGIVVPSLDSCNPVPDQWVLIMVDGSSMVAVGALNGGYRQATLIATSNQTSTVTGLLNGVSTAVTKIGSFTAAAGEEFPLLWSADGSGVWVAAKAGQAYVPPPSGGGGSGGGGGTTPTTHTTSYPASSSGYVNPFSGAHSGNLDLNAANTNGYGFLRYGFGRFHELSSRTIISGRIYLPRISGSGTVRLMVGSGPSFSTVTPGGWVALPLTRINELVSVAIITQAEIRLTNGSGVVKGLPAGTVQITWRN